MTQTMTKNDDGSDPTPEQIEVCREWIREKTRPTTRINRRFGSSYGLKHIVEGWCLSRGFDFYVPGCAFVAAAVLEGYRAAPFLLGSPNAAFNMTWRRRPKRRRGVRGEA